MASGGVHEGPGEHTHIADVLAGGHGIAVGVRPRPGGGDDALHLVGHVEHVLPGQHVLVHGVRHLIHGSSDAGQSRQHPVGGEGEQHAGGGDLGGVADVGARLGELEGGDVALQSGDVGPDGLPAGTLIHGVPAGQLQHGHGEGVLSQPDLHLHRAGVVPGVGQVQRAAPLVGQ